LELIQTLYYINVVDVFSNIEHRILKKKKESKLVHSQICIKIQYIGQLLSYMADDLHFAPYSINEKVSLGKIIGMCYDIYTLYFSYEFYWFLP
jgi:hypothetical protein